MKMPSRFACELACCCLIAFTCTLVLFIVPRSSQSTPDYGDVHRLSDTTSDTGMPWERDEDDETDWHDLYVQQEAFAFDAAVKMKSRLTND